MLTYLENIIKKKDRNLIHRNFTPQLFKENSIHQSFIKNGFVHLKNIFTANEIKTLTTLYEEVSAKETFEHTDFYFNSLSFQDTQIRAFVNNKTLELIKPWLPRFINMEEAKFPLGGNFCISPRNATRGCGLHQDPTLVDETASYSITIWIPLMKTTVENGCLHFIAGSHLWGNYHRSMSITWAFDDYQAYLTTKAKPIPTEIGDIICFDSSVMHSSNTNQTNNDRIAINIPVLPKDTNMISYFPAKYSILKKKTNVFKIDENFFLKESQYEKPTKKYKREKTIYLDNHYTEANIKTLLNESKDLISENQ